MQVGQCAGGAGGGLIGVRDRRGGDQRLHMRQEPGLQQSGGLGAQPRDPPVGYRESQQRVEHPPRAAYRQEMAHVSHAARALTRGPYWTRPVATPGAVASVVVPQPRQVRDFTRCSVTYGRGGGGATSNT